MTASSSNMRGPQRVQAPPDSTRLALIRVGLRLFGEKGFAGTSTRELAAAADANIGSIAYHFGGKEGLRMACAQFIVETMQTMAQRVLPEQMAGMSGIAAAERLSLALAEMVSFMAANPEAGDIVQFVLREVAHPTAALDTIYSGVFEPTHRRLCALWAEATGEDAESEATRIVVFTLVGQVLYFRIGRPAVMRRLGWSDIGAQEAAAITSVVQSNLSAILEAHKGKRS